VGARVVELLFSTFPPKRTATLKLEFYGPHFSLFQDRDLANKVTNVNIDYIISNQPSGKDAALNSLLSLINKGIEKGLFSFAYFQQILCEYVTAATPNDVRTLCSSLVDHSIHLLSTKAGARVVAECATYGTPKDRKRILKSLKGYTRSTLLHSDAYIALLRVLDVTDDTVNVQKAILAELHVLPKKEPKMNVLGEDENDDKEDSEGKKSPLIELILSDTGSKLFLLLLSKDENTKKKYFDPAEMEILRPNTTIKEGEEEVPTSKKSANTRRVELLQYMKNLLCDCCKSHTNELLQSRCGAKVLREVYETFPSKDLADAIVDACENEEGNDDDDDDEYLSVFEHPIGHLSIKNIILCDANASSKDDSVTKLLLTKYGGNLIDDIGASNRGAFVLVSLLASDDSGVAKKEVKKARKEVKKRLNQAKSMSKPYAGYEALLKAIEE
jgi:CPL (NUC119) domain.